MDILFIIEASTHTSSIHSELMTVVGNLAGSLKISTSDIQVGVITFDNVVDENIELNDYYYSASSLDSAITSITIPSASSTVNLADALRYAFYDSFTLSKGNRFTAFKHFVLIAKTYSSQTGAAVADQIRLNLRNQLFTIGKCTFSIYNLYCSHESIAFEKMYWYSLLSSFCFCLFSPFTSAVLDSDKHSSLNLPSKTIEKYVN